MIPEISILICTRNRPEMIGDAVSSVLSSAGPDAEVIVVDQSTDERTCEAIAAVAAGDRRLRYLHMERAGLSAAYNTGMRAARAPIIACTDDDCVVPRDWADAVREAFRRHPDVDLLYGQTLAGDRGGNDIIPYLTVGAEVKLGGRYPFYVYGMGANFATRRALWERLGGFDEVLGGGGPLRSSQDFDFQYRAYKEGALCLLSPAVVVYHYGARTPEQWPSTMIAYGTGDGAFYLKHVRCRDLTALRLMTKRLARSIARTLVNPLRGRSGEGLYLRGFASGMRASLAFPVDARTRLYIDGQGAAR
jgi:glycosyltransferase involved in cell wall biosynthesis